MFNKLKPCHQKCKFSKKFNGLFVNLIPSKFGNRSYSYSKTLTLLWVDPIYFWWGLITTYSSTLTNSVFIRLAWKRPKEKCVVETHGISCLKVIYVCTYQTNSQ